MYTPGAPLRRGTQRPHCYVAHFDTSFIFAGQLTVLSRALWNSCVGIRTHTAVCRTVSVQRRLQSQDSGAKTQSQAFDERMLEHLVCPLSKNDLRYELGLFHLYPLYYY